MSWFPPLLSAALPSAETAIHVLISLHSPTCGKVLHEFRKFLRGSQADVVNPCILPASSFNYYLIDAHTILSIGCVFLYV